MSQNFYQHFRYTIANNELKTIETHATFLMLLSNTSTTPIMVSIGGQTPQELPIGLSIQLKDYKDSENIFTQLIFQNVSGGAVTFTFAVSNGKIENSAFVSVNAIPIIDNASIINSPFSVTATAIAGAAFMPAVPTRKEIVIYNNHASFTVWAGASATTVNGSIYRGIPIKAGDYFILKTSAGVYFHSPSGNAVLSIMEVLT